jgi:hypothetical protein
MPQYVEFLGLEYLDDCADMVVLLQVTCLLSG